MQVRGVRIGIWHRPLELEKSRVEGEVMMGRRNSFVIHF